MPENSYFAHYIPLLIQVIVAMALAAVMVTLSHLLGKRKWTRAKNTAYECGIEPTGEAQQRFSVKFYMVGMLFIPFHVEQDKEHADHIELNAETLLRIAGGVNAAFISCVLGAGPFTLAQQMGKRHHNCCEGHGHNDLDQQRNIMGEVAVFWHEGPYRKARLQLTKHSNVISIRGSVKPLTLHRVNVS